MALINTYHVWTEHKVFICPVSLVPRILTELRLIWKSLLVIDRQVFAKDFHFHKDVSF